MNAPRGAGTEWAERCAGMFEELRKPARAMVARAYGRALNPEEVEDVYSAAWAATLSALRVRGQKLSDQELRAYVLTAVASHASKELRRRSRKPVGSIETAHENVISDIHVPLPEEAAIGSESAGIARDLLTSLPARRRAVMLLRYGWGLSPKEVCALVSGLSPRAYRKEVTKGVEQLIERLKQVESGEWCESRQPLLRDYVAGTAGEDERRQIEHHLGHCRACSTFASRLTGHLHELGSGVALAGVANVILGSRGGAAERLSAVFDSSRAGASGVFERGESAVSTLAASGGVRGSGAAGAGLLAKLAAGGGGKVALACLGTGAAATACVAAGVVPGVGLGEGDNAKPNQPPAPRVERRAEPRVQLDTAEPSTSVVDVSESVGSADEVVPAPDEGNQQTEAKEVEEPEQQPVEPPVDPAVQEFDPVAAAAESTAESAPPAAAPATAPSDSSASGGSSSGSVAAEEFGP